VYETKIMLFDESASVLDLEMLKEVLDTMNGLANDSMTIWCVAHEIGFARTLAFWSQILRGSSEPGWWP